MVLKVLGSGLENDKELLVDFTALIRQIQQSAKEAADQDKGRKQQTGRTPVISFLAELLDPTAGKPQ